MSERGFIAVDRGLFDHPGFANEPFTEREAWLWLIAEAAWKATEVRVGPARIQLQRGQCAFALRFLASKWKWGSDARVRRFLQRRADDAQVTTLATRDATLITICNYDKYQVSRRADDAQSDAHPDAEPTQRRTNKPVNQEEGISSLRSEIRAREDWRWPPGSFEQFWNSYPHKVGKQAALRAFAVAKRSGVEFSTLMFGLNRYVLEKPADRPWCNPATWLTQGRWDDQPAAAATGPPSRGAPRLGSRDDTRERTANAYRKLSDYVDAQADDARRSGGSREEDAGLLPFAKLARP